KSILQSPYYPNSYPAGSSCRYKFTAPLDYDITLNCTINLDKTTNACSTEFFYVARDGDSQLRDSEQFCGSGTFKRKSLFRTVVLAYVSGGSFGSFRCELNVQQHPCDCGCSVNKKISNGQEASVNEFPSMVALRDILSLMNHLCGGFIISHRHILTAANCIFVQAILSNIQAVVGHHNLQQKAQQCISMDYQIPTERDILNITSPNYPNAYVPGSNCRHRITAPRDHVVIMTCLFEVAPNTCDTESFLLSLDGDLQFRDGQRFCTTTQVTRISYFRSMAVAYLSARSNTLLRGRFFCQARARRQPCNCGWSVPTRIANGKETMRNEFPSMVALRDITSPQRVFCGGNIISRLHILTAAHCTRTHSNPSNIVAYAGDHDLIAVNETPFAVQYRIQRILNHPDYRDTANGVINDIAILITTTPMEWSRGVGPICLPWRQQNEPFVYASVDVAGWGSLSFAGAKSNTLQKVDLMVLDNRICQQQYNDTIMASHICTYDFRGLGQDSCQFDSGGPVINRRGRLTLIGIISYGQSCGQPYGIGINTRITSHLAWLWRYTQNDVCVL
ncbi:hypothetical protein DOY81_008023, partial [Sarcophaga bullata]